MTWVIWLAAAIVAIASTILLIYFAGLASNTGKHDDFHDDDEV